MKPSYSTGEAVYVVLKALPMTLFWGGALCIFIASAQVAGFVWAGALIAWAARIVATPILIASVGRPALDAAWSRTISRQKPTAQA